MKNNVSFLQKIYYAILAILLCTIIFTPVLVKSGITIIEEEILEGLLIFVMLAIGYIILKLYKKEVHRITEQLSKIRGEKVIIEDNLNNALKYIGGLNVQINAIKTALPEFGKFPENKKEMQQVMKILAATVLKIVPVDWVLLRILDIQNKKTLKEVAESRGSYVLIKYEISNKDLIGENKKKDYYDYTAVNSVPSEMSIQTFCILPKTRLKKEQKVMLKAILNQLEMLFIIFDSKYYKYRENKNNV